MFFTLWWSCLFEACTTELASVNRFRDCVFCIVFFFFLVGISCLSLSGKRRKLCLKFFDKQPCTQVQIWDLVTTPSTMHHCWLDSWNVPVCLNSPLWWHFRRETGLCAVPHCGSSAESLQMHVGFCRRSTPGWWNPSFRLPPWQENVNAMIISRWYPSRIFVPKSHFRWNLKISLAFGE